MAKARLAYLVKPKKVDGVEGEAIVELREHEIPTPGEGEILVKVEGCGICGTDVHEYRYDPFGMAPVVLGHEGTGEVVAIGPGVEFDTKGDPIKVATRWLPPCCCAVSATTAAATPRSQTSARIWAFTA